jgi:hypothetical protein
MTTSLSTLAINLLISERIGHRKILADKMVELLEKSNDTSAIEKHLKDSFLSVITKCVENPNCKSRDDFFQLAQFYNEKLNGIQPGSSIAA